MDKEKSGIFFEGKGEKGNLDPYPAWRYHDYEEPIIVRNAKEDREAREKGWDNVRAPITADQRFNNYYHDLEDFNNRQLAYYAKNEFGAELPAEASKAKLLWAIWQLAMRSRKTKKRIVLLAQSIRMNYDETVAEVLKHAGDIEQCSEKESEIVWL